MNLCIGEPIAFVAVFEDGTEVVSAGTVADVRDGSAWVYVLGYRWPFQVWDDETVPMRGYYPHSGAGSAERTGAPE